MRERETSWQEKERSQSAKINSKHDARKEKINGSCVCACEGIVASLTQKKVDLGCKSSLLARTLNFDLGINITTIHILYCGYSDGVVELFLHTLL